MNSTMRRRFLSKIEVTKECWNWIGFKDKDGYGCFRIGKKAHRAHRKSYELFRSKIPTGKVIDHQCRNRGCVNPGHLRCVTLRINSTENTESLTAYNTLKTHCPFGHAYTGENLRISQGRRVCRTCRRKSHLSYYWRKGRAKRIARMASKPNKTGADTAPPQEQ